MKFISCWYSYFLHRIHVILVTRTFMRNPSSFVVKRVRVDEIFSIWVVLKVIKRKIITFWFSVPLHTSIMKMTNIGYQLFSDSVHFTSFWLEFFQLEKTIYNTYEYYSLSRVYSRTFNGYKIILWKPIRKIRWDTKLKICSKVNREGTNSCEYT